MHVVEVLGRLDTQLKLDLVVGLESFRRQHAHDLDSLLHGGLDLVCLVLRIVLLVLVRLVAVHVFLVLVLVLLMLQFGLFQYATFYFCVL